MLKAVKHRLGAKKLRGAPYKGLSVRAVFPSAFAGMTVKMEVQASANDSTYNTIANLSWWYIQCVGACCGRRSDTTVRINQCNSVCQVEVYYYW